MLFSVPLDNFEIDNIHYTKSKKNIIMNGLFTKILYSDNCIIMNGLFVDFTLKIKYIHNKSYYVLDEKSKNNHEIFEKLIHMENDILLYYKRLLHQNQAKSICLLKSQLEKGILKFIQYEDKMDFSSVSLLTSSIYPARIHFNLKISGIWQNESNIGLNYKIVSTFLEK